MINVKDKTCEFEGCYTIPIYNYKTEIKPIFCSIHKKENMVNVKDKKCLFEGCDKIPNYNCKGEKKGIYCFTHKKNMDDVISIWCGYKDCRIRASYNYQNEKLHKSEDMINVKSKKMFI